MERTEDESEIEITASTGARRALAKCSLAMCFEQQIEAPPDLCDVAMQLGIPKASMRRLEQHGLITKLGGSWHLTTAGAEVLRATGVRVPRQIVADSCCSCGVERHAYNGCASCSCSVRWPEHPNALLDPTASESEKANCAAERSAGNPDYQVRS